MARRRINISVDEELYQELLRLKNQHRFKSICEMNVALLKVAVVYMRAADWRSRGEDDDRMIINMFNDLGNWEQTPKGVVPITRRRRKEDGIR